MQSTAWELLLRQFPTEQHNTLMLATKAGVEITIQVILRLDHEFMAIRGRLAGSTDSGRLFIIPYQHIGYLGSQQQYSEAEFHARFDGATFPDPAAAAPAAPLAAEPPPVPDEVAALEPAPEPAMSPSARTPPIKSAVLERFRARAGQPTVSGGPRSSEG